MHIFKITFLFYLFSLHCILLMGDIAHKAVICVPIADLIGEPLKKLFPERDVDTTYHSLPVCGGQKDSYPTCPRLHQLLYNDVVEIIRRTHDEVCIRTTHAFYVTPSSTPQSTYWTATKNVRLFSELPHEYITSTHIPAPIDFNDPHHLALTNDTIITLIEPHYDPITKLTFSAGTRFVKTPQQKKMRSKHITAHAFDYKKNKPVCISLPLHKCISHSHLMSSEQQISHFIQLLQKWIHHQHNHFIPYIWGGTSFTTTQNSPFTEKTMNLDGKETSWYEFAHDTTSPKSGFDCSGLILRAAQMSGIPYFCKNTTTIAHCLNSLTANDTIANGDLILFKGHVLVISDAEQNKVIEARGYGHGYGKLQEIAIGNVFEGINSYKDLHNAYYDKKPLKRKDVHGVVRDTFNDWKIISMKSVYKNNNHS